MCLLVNSALTSKHIASFVPDSATLMEWKVQDVPPDGNCFFHCLGLCTNLGVSGDSGQYRSTMLRTLVGSYSERHGHIMVNGLQLFRSRHNLEQFVQRIMSNGSWAGDLELVISSVALNLHIHVYTPDFDRSVLGREHAQHGWRHYNPELRGRNVLRLSISRSRNRQSHCDKDEAIMSAVQLVHRIRNVNIRLCLWHTLKRIREMEAIFKL